MTEQFDDFTWPDHVVSIDRVPPPYRPAYSAPGTGGWDLHPEIAAERDRLAAEREALAAEHAATIAALDAKIERGEARARDHAVTDALDAALRAGGCKPKLVPGAAAYLKTALQFEVTGDPAGDLSVSVNSQHGRVSVDHTVKSWIDGVEGAEFRQAPTAAGPTVAAMRALRDALH